jgi:tetratricopeptide (TPR) repeat protein
MTGWFESLPEWFRWLFQGLGVPVVIGLFGWLRVKTRRLLEPDSAHQGAGRPQLLRPDGTAAEWTPTAAKRRERRVTEGTLLFVALFTTWLPMTGQSLGARLLLSPIAVCIVALAYLGLVRRVTWRRQALGVALALTVVWIIAASCVWSTPKQHITDVLKLAEKLRDRGFYAEARAQLQHECGGESAHLECLCTLGTYDIQMGDRKGARQHLEACAAKAVETNQTGWHMAGLLGLGDLEAAVDRNDVARRYYLDALELAGECAIPYGAFRANAALSGLAAKHGRLDEAQAFASKALAIATDAKQANAVADAQVLLGNCATGHGADQSALDLYHSAANTYDQTGNRYGRACVDVAAANLRRKRAEISIAEPLYKGALGQFEQWEDKGGQAEILLSLATIEHQSGRLSLAREHFAEALHLFEELEDLNGQANALIESAHLERSMGELPAAREHYAKGLVLSQRAESRISEANALLGLSSLEAREWSVDPKANAVHLQRAFDRLDQARKAYKEIGDVRAGANCDVAEALLMYKLGRKEEGRAAFQRAIAVFQRLGMGAYVQSLVEQIEQQAKREP